jgi:hypothetical protein
MWIPNRHPRSWDRCSGIEVNEAIAPVHEATLLTYLRLSGNTLGLLINFNVPILKVGIRRFVLKHIETQKELR